MNILYAISTKSDLERKTFCVKIAVDLLVRSWVEIYPGVAGRKRRRRRPPREVVSWNSQTGKFTDFSQVDLLVRSWVEISSKTLQKLSWLVDLLVRSWVEIQPVWQSGIRWRCRPPREVVSWNVERIIESKVYRRRPPREVVSWNGNITLARRNGLKSTSSWGRELK